MYQNRCHIIGIHKHKTKKNLKKINNSGCEKTKSQNRIKDEITTKNMIGTIEEKKTKNSQRWRS